VGTPAGGNKRTAREKKSTQRQRKALANGPLKNVVVVNRLCRCITIASLLETLCAVHFACSSPLFCPITHRNRDRVQTLVSVECRSSPQMGHDGFLVISWSFPGHFLIFSCYVARA
jgi:hypothetical protein